MDEEDSERQRKLKAGRQKLLQFQQKKRGGKKKKASSGKSTTSEQVSPVRDHKQQHSESEHGASSPANSVASADAEKDISSIASEVEAEGQAPLEQHVQEERLVSQSGEESNTASYASGSYTSGEESYTSEDGGVDDLVIANLERNELKNRTFELEEQLAAKKTALKDISKENAELKAKLNDIQRASSGGDHATVVLELSQKIDNLEKNVHEKQSAVYELQKENEYLRKRIEKYQDVDMSESSQVEELKEKLKTKQLTLDELNKQNEDLSEEVSRLRMELNDPARADSSTLAENLRMKQNTLEQLSVENENQRFLIKSLEDGFNQSKAQLYEYHKELQLKEQKLNQLTSIKEYSEALKLNIAELNEQLMQKDREIEMTCYERDKKLWQASQEIARLQQVISTKESESQSNASNVQEVNEYERKIADLTTQLAESNNALKNLKSQLTQVRNQQKQGEKEVFLLKSHIQEQTGKLLSSQEELNNFKLACEDREQNVLTLQNQLQNLSNVHEDMSQRSQTISQQMLELQGVLSDRNQKISYLETSLSELSEEKELLKKEMTNQSEQFVDQLSNLRDQLNESNAKVLEQSEEMENSFSELHVTQDMIKDLQKEMLEKDFSLDNLSQKLRSSEADHKEVLEDLQKKFIEEKERWQYELQEKEAKLSELNLAYSEFQLELNQEKSVNTDLVTKTDELHAEVESHKKEAMDLREALETKEQALNNFGNQQHKEIESLKLELEKLKKEAMDSDERVLGISENHEEEMKRLKQDFLEKENLAQEFSNRLQDREKRIESLKVDIGEKLQQIEALQNQLDRSRQEHDELKSSSIAERQCLEGEFERLREEHENQMQSNQMINKALEEKLQATEQQLNDVAVNEDTILSLKEEMEHQREEYEKVVSVCQSLTTEREKLLSREEKVKNTEEDHVAKQSDDDESKLEVLNRRIKEMEVQLRETQTNEKRLLALNVEKELLFKSSEQENKQELVAVNEKLRRQSEEHENEVKLLQKKLYELQANQEEYMKEKEQLFDLLKGAEEKVHHKDQKHQNEIALFESRVRELQESQEDHEKENEQLASLLKVAEEKAHENNQNYQDTKLLLENRVQELQEKQQEFVDEKKQLVELVKKTEDKLRDKEEGHEQEIKQMDEQLEQTRQVIETMRKGNENKVARLEECLTVERKDMQQQLQMKEEQHKEMLVNMEIAQNELKTELEKEKARCVTIKEQLEGLVKERSNIAMVKEKNLEDFDWSSNNFEQEAIDEKNILASADWMESQTSGAGPSIFNEEGTNWENVGAQQAKEVDLSKKTTVQELSCGNDLDSLQEITFLQEKLAEKEKSELELIEEKNKLLKIVKEYNNSLANERDTLKEKIIDQDQTIKDLQDQLMTSELVSSDLQQVFGRQLLVLQEQRDSLLGQLEEQNKDRSSFVDILEEKHALEENLRSEKEQLADKLRQKEMLEVQLEQERGALQEQLIRQARLNEIIREKDVLEEELTEQKNRLQLELSTIESSLLEKEQLLQREKEALQSELHEKNVELLSWQGEFKTKEENLVQERERLEKSYRDTLLATRTELEDTYQQSLQHLRTDLELGYEQRLFEMQQGIQSHHEEQLANLNRQHEQQVSGLKTEYEEKIKHLKEVLEEQRQKQVSTMKNVLERDREQNMEHVMYNHDNDMENLRQELNLRHQDIVSAIVNRLKQSHEQEMEECLAKAVTDTVLKVEVTRLEVEREYELKFDELRNRTKLEIKNLKELHEGQSKELKAKYQKQLQKNEEVEKRNAEVVEELRTNYNKRLTLELNEQKKKLDQEHEKNIENMREVVEMDYEDQMETLQDELESKCESSLRELREELDKQSHEITASAVEELQQKHFSEIDLLKSEHEHVIKQMNIVRKKMETSYKEDIEDLEEKLKREKEKLTEMESRFERMVDETKKDENGQVEALKNTMEQKTLFLEEEYRNKMADIQREMEKQLTNKDQAFSEEYEKLRGEFEKEKMATELKYLTELQKVSADAEKRVSEKEQECLSDIDKLQQKLIMLKEAAEDDKHREVDQTRQQLSEKYQNDLDAIVRELKLQHHKQVENLISEAESNQVNAELQEFEKWKMNLVEKNETEVRDLKSKHQRELESLRRVLEEGKLEEVHRFNNALSAKHEKEIDELRKKLTDEYEDELKRTEMEVKSKFEKESEKLYAENELLRQQHDDALRDLQNKLSRTLSKELDALKEELRVYIDLVQEKELEIENLKRDHQKVIKELKQLHYDDLLEEVSRVRADLALDFAREVEVVKMESDYELAKKVKDVQDIHLKEIAVLMAKVESLEKEKESLDKLFQLKTEEAAKLKTQLVNERNELNQTHDEAIESLKTKFDVDKQNALNELKVQLIKERDEMEEMLKRASDDEFKKLKAILIEQESQLKAHEKERKDILNDLKRDHEKELTELRETLNRDHEVGLEQLKQDCKKKIQDADEKFAEELKIERDRLEKEKQKDLATFEEAFQTRFNEKHELQLKLVNEQHSHELESLREELVKTHMEKFTLMTEQLEQAHQEELKEMRKSTEDRFYQEYEAKLGEAEELARYKLEQEHVENLKNLEENLQQKHEGQLSGLKDLIERHGEQLKTLGEEREFEKQSLVSDWQKKLSDELITVRSEHIQEMKLKNDLLDKAETEIKRYVLEVEAKDKNLQEMSEFIETTSAEYEERLAKIRKQFDDKLNEMKSNADTSFEEQLRGVQELLSKQHTDELERLKDGHEKHIELINNELKGARAMKIQVQEELEEKLLECANNAAEQEQLLKNQVSNLEQRLTTEDTVNEELKERNENMKKTLEEKEKELKEVQDQKQAVELDVRTLNGHVREMENRHKRERLEYSNLITMLRADLDVASSERDSLQRAKDKLMRQLSTAVRTTLITEETITSRLETLIEQTMREDGDENDTISEVNSISETEDSIPEGFRRRLGAALMATSTPAVLPLAAPDFGNDNDDDERTLTDDGMKQAGASFVSDEGLELSAVLSDSIIGSVDLQNEQTVVDSGNRLRVAVQKLLDMVTSVTNQLNDARGTQDELLNTTAQRTEELNQLTQTQQMLMVRLEEEIKNKEEMTNRLRNAEEQMEVHVSEIDRLEALLQERDAENKEKPSPEETLEKEKQINDLEKEKEKLHQNIESLKSKTEDMEKSYNKEKEELCEKIEELQRKLSQMEDEFNSKTAKEEDSQNSKVSSQPVADEREEIVKQGTDSPVAEEKPGLAAEVESLKLECLSQEAANKQLKEQQQQLQSKVLALENTKSELEENVRENQEKLLQEKKELEEEIQRLKSAVVEKQVHQEDRAELKELVKENELLKQKVDSLKENNKNLTNTLQTVVEEKTSLQSTLEQSEVAWEEEKNTLQQQLYDSCLEASSYKDRLNKSNQEASNIAQLEEKLFQQNEAYKALENDASNLKTLVNELKESLSLKEEEANVLEGSVEEIKKSLTSQQNILKEQQERVTQAENEKLLDEKQISDLKNALAEAEKKVAESQVKMQEILTNMRNLEETYKVQSTQGTQQLSEKIEVLQKELTESKIKLEQQTKQNNELVAHQISELKQHHAEEIQSLRSQFETEVQDAVERTKANLQPIGDYTNETDHGIQVEYEGSASDVDSSVEARLNIEIMNVNSFTRTIAGYFSDLAQMAEESFGELDASEDNTSEKIETILDDVRMEADAIYNLVHHVPTFYDPNFKSLQMAWREEKEILSQAIKQMKEIVVQIPEELSGDKDWRATVLKAVLDFLNKEEEMLSSELQAMEQLTRTDAAALSKLIKKRQQKQDELHRHSVDRLYQTDRVSLKHEIYELQNTLASVKEELTQENNKLQEQLSCIHEQVQKREKQLLQQVASKETLVQQERNIINELHAEIEAEKKRTLEANDLITRERTSVKDLQDILNKNKTRLKMLETAVEKERTQTAVIQTCLNGERTRCSNLEQALKRERSTVEAREREVEEKRKMLEDMSTEQRDSIKQLRNTSDQLKQQLSELETQLEQEKKINAKVKANIVEKEKLSLADNEKLNTIIRDLKEKLSSEESRNNELVKTLNEERRVAEDLKSSLASVDGVSEQIAEQEQLITDLSNALDKERRVNEELRNALDSEYEDLNKTDDRQVNLVKELQTSLTAVQKQLQNQIVVVDQERLRAKRLRKERDIHEATALGARDKERKLENELEKEKAAREREGKNLKCALEIEVAEKKNLERMISERNTEFEVLCRELQRLKDDKTTSQPQTPPNSPSRDRLNILRHDLKSLIDEHRVLLIMQKDYLGEQLKNTPNNTNELSNLRSHVENLLNEMDRIKVQLGSFPEGPSIPLSPIRAAAYDRMTKQNRELADYVAKLTEEKTDLRSTLSNLELQISQYRQREARHEENSRRNKHEMEVLMTNERSRAAHDRVVLQQTIDGQRRQIYEMENELREKENEVVITKRTLHAAEEELERNKASVKHFQTNEMHLARWTPARIQKLYGRYMRAEKSRKSLTYQKKYLVLLLGGFRESETRTLSLIAKMGAYPSYQPSNARFSSAFTKFRTVVRLVIAVKRMQFLVKKSKNSIKQVIEPADSTRRINSQKITNPDVLKPYEIDRRPKNAFKTNYLVRNDFSSSSPLEVSNVHDSRYHHDISLESKDITFADLHPSSVSPPVDGLNRVNSDVISRYDDKMIKTTLSTTNYLPLPQTTSYQTNRAEILNRQSLTNSPPVRERCSTAQEPRSSIRQPFSTSLGGYSFPGREKYSQHAPDVRLRYDSQDLERKIQTLDNLQQKLSATRGPNDRARPF